MDTAYISALAALAGSVIGGVTSFATTWLTQRSQTKARQPTQAKTRRQDLYTDFVIEASRLYADSLVHDKVEVSALVGLYADVNRMRILSSSKIVENADRVMRIIIDTYLAENKTFPELRDMLVNGKMIVPLQGFSEACREEQNG
jgi:hypothetical protein